MYIVKALNHPDANIYFEYLNRKFVGNTFGGLIFGKLDTRNLDLLKKHCNAKKISFLYYKDTLLIKANDHTFQIYNAKKVTDSDLLEYLSA